MFFRELCVALNTQSKEEPVAKAAADRLTVYSKAASFGAASLKVVGKAMSFTGLLGGPVLEAIGHAADAASEVASKGADAQKSLQTLPEPSLHDFKRLISDDMRKLKRPLLVVIDDIDRLTTDEIREVFQLVKANADFPNLIYLLLFDREIVAGALNSIAGGRGHEFLDKIIQALFHVPQPSIKSVHQVLFKGLDAQLAEAGVGERWETPRWGRVWSGGLSAYFSNLRSVYRFLGSFAFQVSQMRHGKTFELNPLDLIILETLRLFEPALYEALPSRREVLTTGHVARVYGEKELEAALNTERDTLVALAKQQQHSMREIIAALFPALFGHKSPDSLTMQKQLRVGHESFFDRYFTMSLAADDVPQADIDALREHFGNPQAFSERCRSLLSRNLLETAFERLDAYKQDYPTSLFPAIITSLIDAADMLPEKDRRVFDTLGALSNAYRLIYFGLKRVENDEQRDAFVRSGTNQSQGVRLAVKLLQMEQRRPEDRSTDFVVSEQLWAELKPVVLQRVEAAAASGRLRKLADINYILWRWKEWAGETPVKRWIEAELKKPDDALWLLKVFLSISRSESDKVTFTRYIRLDWLADFVDIELVTKLTRTFDLAKLQLEDMRAIRAFRQALEWRDAGKPANFTGDRLDGGNPLEEDS
jgi:predicted KAP-like P-loop ATPase